MKLAFNSQARYTDFSDGYKLYIARSRKGESVDETMYKRIIRKYCSRLAEHLQEYGIIDLPNEMGSIAVAEITRRPQYRGKQFIGYGKMDWKKGHYDGTLKSFGFVFLPKRNKKQNLRCYGFVANRELYKKMKDIYQAPHCSWHPIVFNDEMI